MELRDLVEDQLISPRLARYLKTSMRTSPRSTVADCPDFLMSCLAKITSKFC